MTTDTRFQLAILYQENNREDEAIRIFNDILEIDPKYTSVYPLLGLAYEKQQQLDDAYRTYQAGLAQDETNVRLYRLAGLAAEKTGDKTIAKEYYHKALKIDDADVMTIIALSELLITQHKFDDMINMLTQYLTEDISDPQFYWYLARAYQATGNDDKAQEYWKQSEPLFQENATFLLDIIAWYHQQGNRDAEISAMKQYLFLEPNDADMQIRLEDLVF